MRHEFPLRLQEQTLLHIKLEPIFRSDLPPSATDLSRVECHLVMLSCMPLGYPVLHDLLEKCECRQVVRT